MNYNEIKKMGEAYAQVQEKMRQENADRAEAMLKFEAEKLAAMRADVQEAIKVGNSDDDAIKMRKKIQNEKAPKVAKDKDVSVKGIAKASDKFRANLKNATEGAKQGEPIKGKIGKPIKADASNDKSDDGDGMDKVDKKAVKKKFDDRKDKDIDNDGDTDDSDEYLHKRRKAISKNSGKGKDKETEVQTQEKVKEAASTGAGSNSDSVAQDKTDGMSPNAKKELDRAVKEPAIDADKSNKLNFASFKKMTKKSKDN